MEGKQRLYFALGNVAYAVAMADGKLEAQEKKKVHDIVVKETAHCAVDFDISEIIFHVLQQHHNSADSAYDWGLKAFEMSKSWLTEDLKVDFFGVLEKIARAIDGINESEQKMLDRFRKDMDELLPPVA